LEKIAKIIATPEEFGAMTGIGRLKNRLIAALFTRFPSLGAKAAKKVEAMTFDTTPFTRMSKPLSEAKLALITTAGVHLRQDTPFDMSDPDGDPTFRVIDSGASVDELMITHDYYNHTDADRDINIVFPIERLREFASGKRIGQLASKFYGFMGHIQGRHINSLVDTFAGRVIDMLKEDGVDVVLLTPG